MELIKLGSLSILHKNIGKKTKFDGFDSSKEKQCLAYGRDRDEKDVEATSFKGLPGERQVWNYLFEDGKWLVAHNDCNDFVPLTDEMIKSQH